MHRLQPPQAEGEKMTIRIHKITIISAAGRTTRRIVSHSASRAEDTALRLMPQNPRGFLMIHTSTPLQRGDHAPV